MALRLLYLVFLRVTQLIRLLRRDGNDLAVVVVMLRPEVTVLRRQVSRPALQPASSVPVRRRSHRSPAVVAHQSAKASFEQGSHTRFSAARAI